MKLLMSAIVLMWSFVASAEAVMLGLVDIQKVLVTVKEGQSVMKTLEKSFNDKKSKLKKEEEKIKKLQEDLKKQSSVLSDTAKMGKEREMQEMMYQLQGKTMEYQKEIQEQERELKKPIIDRLREVIEDVSKKAEVDMTFEVSSSPIVYAKNKKDLTEEVVKAYDQKFPSK